ncbi:TetR family transcriptional regulator C-terminal domain-containing protein [Bradyrhizobium sp. U87765 SZCCT0131]|uniref:TetR/AcrR family transcriptional regulator n=1 Tax=unclassified Bradyrhizobium TaxID=2631580 RepID=UPI001BAAECF8|nr:MULTISPECIES: TetR/AcrR family transcriptional regulator [unclassified Bradyrhizobium]MBR1217365.1 TetR family transcriptional regulator C-terminal domain-containing protein [Bradyrhizobium sp. U87765 SZCCT0131]MBR1265038.1 TetR family transcriptional regulator C-terminal domain-containing protein [Bradyrhizobium sp. U87765 SZCCT0134]MBR1305020.1 TetR family transcriptional regulator C-terminal domain-containing protein [Bradyrhizobium sp. U87765 SZCCT0110]MBR1320806.1 TetR family transcript
MAKASLKQQILEAGHDLIWAGGYAATGVRDIVAAAKAPQGSFTNHFRSKEDFALEVLDRYFAYVQGLVAEALGDTTQPPTVRLKRYLDLITTKLADADFARGCLIGNFSLETAGTSERLRARLSEIFALWRQPFADCIAEAQAAGEITDAFTADDLADFLLASWQGAMLRMKVDRSPAPLERFKSIALATIFGKAKS